MWRDAAPISRGTGYRQQVPVAMTMRSDAPPVCGNTSPSTKDRSAPRPLSQQQQQQQQVTLTTARSAGAHPDDVVASVLRWMTSHDLSSKVTAELRRTTVQRSVSADFARAKSSSSGARGDGMKIGSAAATGDKRKMARHSDVEECLNWIDNQQNDIDAAEVGTNKQSIDEAVAAHEKRSKSIAAYRPNVERVKFTVKDQQEIDEVSLGYDALTSSSGAHLKCLSTLSQIAGLESMFATLSNQTSEQAAASTTKETGNKMDAVNHANYGQHEAIQAQNSILAVQDTWAWLGRLMKCAEIHVQNAADYQKFFYDVHEMHKWMTADKNKAEQTINPKSEGVAIHGQTAQLLTDMKSAMVASDNWRGKVDAMIERSRKVVPVQLRNNAQLAPSRPVRSLAAFKTNEVGISEGEELTLVSNRSADTWQVRTRRGKIATVPSTIIIIPGPDPEAEKAAAKLRADYQAGWNDVIKKAGKKLINYLGKVIPHRWSPQQENKLKSLSKPEKQSVLKLLDSIDKTFSPLWDPYRPYKVLKNRADKLRDLLGQQSTGDSASRDSSAGSSATRGQNGLTRSPATRVDSATGSSPGSATNNANGVTHQASDLPELLQQLEPIEDVLNDYGDYWETVTPLPFKSDKNRRSSDPDRIVNGQPMTKYSEGRPFLPVVDSTSSTQPKYLGVDDWLKHVQEGLDLEDEFGFEEYGEYEEWTQKPEDVDVFTIETAKETAQTQQLTTSEVEERKTFVITAVLDPRNGQEISLERAVAQGIINQTDGTYVNPWTRESIPIPTAMNAGKIKVEFTTIKKTAEKHSDLGLITIKLFKESRPFTVKSVMDAKTDRQLSVDEAIKAGILDQKRSVYVNKNNGEELSLTDALDSGLLIVEFDSKADPRHQEPESVTKTYAVHAVSDVKHMKRLAFGEAVACGLVDPETGAYRNNSTGEVMYVGDAIKKGFIKATVVNDPRSLDIAPGNHFNMENTVSSPAAIKKFQAPVTAIGAFGGRSSLHGNGSYQGKR